MLLAKTPTSEIIFSTLVLLVSYLPCYACTQDPTAAGYFSQNTNKGQRGYNFIASFINKGVKETCSTT